MKNSILWRSAPLSIFMIFCSMFALGQGAPPITNINGTVCAGDNAQFRVTTSCSNIQWLASPGGVIQGSSTMATVIVVWSSASSNAWVQASYSNCSTSFLALTVVAKSNPTVTLTTSTTVCQPQTITLQAQTTNVSGSPNYSWYIDNGPQPVAVTSTPSYNYSASGLTPGNHTASVTISAMSCSNLTTVSGSQSFVVNPNVGQVSTPSGLTSRCVGSGTNTYTASATNATGYTWSITPAAGTISSGGVVTWNSSFTGTATVNVTASGCNGSTSSASLNVAVTPGVGGVSAPAGPTSRCIGSGTDSYTATAPNATGYTWTLAPAAAGSISPQGGTVVWSSTFSGLATVTVTASGCTGFTSSASTNVNIIPVVGAVSTPSGTSSRCMGTGTDTYSASATNASSYTWSITPAAGTISSSGIVTWNGSFTGTATISVIANGCNGSTSSSSRSVSVIPGLGGPVSAPSGVTNRCVGGGTNTYTASAPNATSYTWTITPSAGTITNSGVVTWNGLFTGTATVTVTANGCLGTSSTASTTVIVENVGIVNIDGISSRCMGSGSDAFGATANNAVSFTFQLEPSSAGTIVNGAAGYVTWNASFFGSATITATATGCNGVTRSATKTVYVTPKVSQVSTPFGSLTGCQGLSPTNYTAGAVNTSGYNWSISPSTAGTISNEGTEFGLSKSKVTWNSSFSGTATISVTALGCTPTSSSATIEITANPTVSLTPTGVLSTVPTTLSTSNVAGYTYQWYLNGSPLSGKNQFSLIVSNPGTYAVMVSSGGCSVSAPIPATVVVGDYSGFVDPNYIKERIALVEKRQDGQPLSETDMGTLSIGERQETINYFDGLGRLMQKVTTQGSISRADEVQPVVYDNYNREPVKYLPYTTGNDGTFKSTFSPKELTIYQTSPQYLFYQGGGKLITDTKPYSETFYEESPINRPLKNYGSGASWSSSENNKFIGHQYLLNTHSILTSATAEKVIAWRVDDATGMPVRRSGVANYIETTGHFSSKQLSVNVTVDEDGNAVREYSNKLGQVVLKKVQVISPSTNLNSTSEWALTYYIYDDRENLRYVFQPELSKKLHAGSDAYVVTGDDLKNFAFRYKFDARNRMIEKQVPGVDTVFMVYDNRDRLVLTQDGNQKLLTEWTFTKYDAFNRPVLTGKYISGSNRTTLQTDVDLFYQNLTVDQAWFETYVGAAGARLGYDNKSFPTTSLEQNYLTVTYYDRHDNYIAPAGYTYTYESLADPETSLPQETLAAINAVKLSGQVTGMLIRNLYSNLWLRTVNYYDAKYRLVQSISAHHKGAGSVRVSNVIDFAGKVLMTSRTYVVNGVTTIIKDNPEFDHMGRLKWVKHSVNHANVQGPEIVLSKNDYNELGQLVDKKLHSADVNGTGAKQSIDYRYNIRGWLTRINDSNLTVEESDPKDFFGMNLAYNDNFASGYAALTNKAYNGNIAAMRWSSSLGEGRLKEFAYEFSYDAMSRLLNATHKQSTALNTWAGGQYDENGLSYDLNGNILGLQRKGEGGVTIDNLVYNYGSGTTLSNKLLYVKDITASAVDKVKGFNDINAGDIQDYTYDFNGNLTHDLNKGIGTTLSDEINKITYNFLNLPETVTKGGNDIRYIYDATGRKLSQITTYGTITKQVDYIGELQYENDALQFINHAEGRIAIASTKLIFVNTGETTSGVTASNAAVSLVTQNGTEKYIKATSNGTVQRTGMFPIGGTIPVVSGERYMIRVKGYRTGTSLAYVLVKGNGADLNWPGAKLPSGVASESWIEQIVTIPAGTSTLQAGLVWNTVTAGENIFLNEFEIIKLSVNAAPEYQYYLKDHLGNVRATFTTVTETEQTKATLETANADLEASQYLNYDEAVKINSILFNHTNDASSGGTVAVTDMDISLSTLTLAPGQTGYLTAVIIPADATNQSLNWISSNPAVATVSNGAVTAVAGGTAIITATSVSNSSIAKSCTVSVGGASSGLSPLIVLKFNENGGTTPASTGTLSSAFTRTATTPAWSTNVPATVGGASALDFGAENGNYVVESTGVIDGLKGLNAFTITGWINCKSSTTGSGGNRIVSWINHGGDGVDLVYNNNGSLNLGIDAWPDGSPAFSSANKVPVNASAPASNWVFFAVTYQSSNSQVQFYFGDNTTDASLDVTRTYARGVVGTNIARLAIGHFNSATRVTGTLDRMFKGLIDEIQIHGVALTPAEIISVQRSNQGSSTVSVTAIEVHPASPTLKLGQTTTVQLATTISPANATNQSVEWVSNNPSVATVSQSGLVTAVAAGTATITASSVSNPSVSGPSTVTVNAASAGLSPLIALKFNENSGTAPANTGSLSSVFTRTSPTPAWSTNVPATVGGASALDFGTTNGNFVVESTTEIDGLKDLTAFTITGWVNCKSSATGSGGNRIISWINHGGDGVDLVYSNGTLRLGIDAWPDGTTAFSTANKIPTDASGAASNWVFFAVTYQSSNGQVQFYFGNNATDASLDVTRTYAQGAVGTNIARLAIGHFNSATRVTGTLDRMFKGLIDDIQIHGAALTPTEIVSVQRSNSGSTIAVTAIEIGPDAPTLTLGGMTTVQLATTITPSNASNQNVTWTSSNTSVATVNGGLVTAVAAGTATITATSISDPSVSDPTTVTVNPASGGSNVQVTNLSVSPGSLTLTQGQTGQLTKTITPSNATNQNVGWISSNKAVATVSASGLVTAVATGTATVTATSIDGGFKEQATITVNGTGPTSYYSTRLSGTSSEQYGLARSLSVMPGDIITTEVFVKYLDTNSSNWSTALNNLMTSIAAGTAPSGTLIDGGLPGSIGGGTLPITPINHSSEGGTAPKAYLNYIVFGKDISSTPLNFGFKRISTAAIESGQDAPHQRLAFDGSEQIVITEPGYVYIYISNENGTPVEVYFDDFKVEHIKGPIVSSQDYYPFGLTFSSYQRENSVVNKHRFQGQEHIDNLNLGWDSFKWRNHQPDIGRFFNVDPLAEKYYYNSPYAFSENKVTTHVELEGLESEHYLKKEVQKVESAVKAIPGAIADGASKVGSAISNRFSEIGNGIKSAWNSIGPGDDRGGSTWTTKEHSGGDQSKVPEGKSDGGGNVDALIGPTIRSSPAATPLEGFFQGFEMATIIESKTQIIENVVKETGGNTTSLKVKEVKDTISDYKNMSQYLVTTTSGKDSIIQTSKTPDTQDDKKK